MDLKIDECPTPLGTMLAVHDAGDALVALVFSDHAAALPAWLQRQGLALASAVTAPVARTRRALDAYFAGDLVALCTLPLHWTGTAFQRACWQALLRIAPGAPISYAEQARAIGRPGAARAVGGANALMIGNVIERQFKAANDWPFGAALSFLLMYATFGALALRYLFTLRSKGVDV